jgi:hypothetical protein
MTVRKSSSRSGETEPDVGEEEASVVLERSADFGEESEQAVLVRSAGVGKEATPVVVLKPPSSDAPMGNDLCWWLLLLLLALIILRGSIKSLTRN